jgi:hypothetical protein
MNLRKMPERFEQCGKDCGTNGHRFARGHGQNSGAGKGGVGLKILNKWKDFFVEQRQKERNGFFDQLLTTNRKLGELETKLLQLESPPDL